LPGSGIFLKWRGSPQRETCRQLADTIIRPPNFKAEKTMKEVVINMCEVSVRILYSDVTKIWQIFSSDKRAPASRKKRFYTNRDLN
jgi:hypothetical protein